MSDTFNPNDAAMPSSCPADVPDDPLSRRLFVKVGLGAFGAAYAAGIAYPVYRYLAAPAVRASEAAAVTEVEIPDAMKLQPGSALMFRFGTRPAMLIHHADDSWVALSAVCTHLGCTVQYEKDKQRIHCACHGGVYDARTGANVSGPPPKPLQKFNVEVANGKVIVKRA
jgi:cytochrome b6-f complex iron-sulfur subunit